MDLLELNKRGMNEELDEQWIDEDQPSDGVRRSHDTDLNDRHEDQKVSDLQSQKKSKRLRILINFCISLEFSMKTLMRKQLTIS